MTQQGGSFVIPSDAPADIRTAAGLTDEQVAMRKAIREFMDDQVHPRSEALEAKNWSLSRELLRKLGGLGFLGIEVPEAYGGLDLDKVTAAIVAEEVGRHGSFAATFLDHTGIGTSPIRYFGNEDQKRRYLPGLVEGRTVGVYCLTEAGSGSDANGARATAVLSADGSVYTLNGEKTFVTSGGFADLFTVFAQIPGAGLTAFLVERTFPGVTLGKEEVKMGIRGSSTVSLSLADVPVPAANLLGEPGKGFKIALNILNLGRFKLAAACLGASRLCLEDATAWAATRKQFGKTIREFGLIRAKLARMAAYIFAMESIVYRTAGLLDEAIGGVDTNDPAAVLKAIESCAVECSAAKVFNSDALDRIIADENVQVYGGYGFVGPYRPERQLRDARINRIFEGTNEINRLLVVGMLMKKALQGILPLLQEGAKIREEVVGGSPMTEPEGIPERLLFQLNGAKKATLLASGIVAEKLGQAMAGDDNQEVVGMLADALIAVYALDSTLGALAKQSDGNGEAMARLVFAELLPEVERNARNALAAVCEGDELRVYLGAVKKLLKYAPENVPALNRAIVAGLPTGQAGI